MDSLPHRLADRLLGRRRLAIVLVLLVGVAAAISALRVEADFTPEELFTDSGPLRRDTREFRAHFGNTDNVLLVLLEADDVLAPRHLGYLRALTRYLDGQAYAASAASITNIPLPRRSGPARPASEPISVLTVASDIARGRLNMAPIVAGPIDDETARELGAALADVPLVWGQLIARDRSVAVVAVTIDPELDRVDELERVVADVERYLSEHPPPSAVKIHLAGLPYIRVDVVRKVGADQTVLFPAAFLVILLLLYATFRWLPAVLLPLLVVGLSAAVLMGILGAVGEQLNIINNIVPILVIIIGISDSIHFVNRYGEELAGDTARHQAARRALRTMLVALLLTSFTTAVGFGSLAVSQLPALARFGLTAAVGVLVAYAITICFLPAALSYLRRPRRAIADVEHGAIERLVGAVTDATLRRRWLVIAVSAVLLALCIGLARQVRIDTAVHHQWRPGSNMYDTLELLEEKLDGLRPVEIGLFAGPGRFHDPDAVMAIDRVTRWARQQPGVLSAASYADLLRHAWFVASGDPAVRDLELAGAERITTLANLLDRAPEQNGWFVTSDRSKARISVRLADMGGVATLELVDDLRRQLADLPAGIDYVITGEGYVSSAGLTTLTRDLLTSLLLAIAVIFGFLTLVLRSLRLGLISVPPNALPLVATIAYLWVRDIPLSPATVIIFSVSVGLAVDGTIHVLARFREELAGGADADRALRIAARGTGKAVVVSYVSLIIGFVVFRLSNFVPVQQFGELISVTVIGCLISTLVLLPALVSVAYRRKAD